MKELTVTIIKELAEAGLLKYKHQEGTEYHGFCFNGKFVWHWFRHWKTLQGEFLTFDHSYSQDTGRTDWGIRRGYQTEKAALCLYEKLKAKEAGK